MKVGIPCETMGVFSVDMVDFDFKGFKEEKKNDLYDQPDIESNIDKINENVNIQKQIDKNLNIRLKDYQRIFVVHLF